MLLFLEMAFDELLQLSSKFSNTASGTSISISSLDLSSLIRRHFIFTSLSKFGSLFISCPNLLEDKDVEDGDNATDNPKPTLDKDLER